MFVCSHKGPPHHLNLRGLASHSEEMWLGALKPISRREALACSGLTRWPVQAPAGKASALLECSNSMH